MQLNKNTCSDYGNGVPPNVNVLSATDTEHTDVGLVPRIREVRSSIMMGTEVDNYEADDVKASGLLTWKAHSRALYLILYFKFTFLFLKECDG